MSEFFSKIVGVTAKNPDGMDRQKCINAYVRAGMPLLLRPEPCNKYDENAVAVYVKARVLFIFSGFFQIGYLKSEVAKEVSKFIAAGGAVSCCVSEVTGSFSRGMSLGVNIRLTKHPKS